MALEQWCFTILVLFYRYFCLSLFLSKFKGLCVGGGRGRRKGKNRCLVNANLTLLTTQPEGGNVILEEISALINQFPFHYSYYNEVTVVSVFLCLRFGSTHCLPFSIQSRKKEEEYVRTSGHGRRRRFLVGADDPILGCCCPCAMSDICPVSGTLSRARR